MVENQIQTLLVVEKMGGKKGSIPFWTGARNQDQQDALHLQVVENFLAIFLIVMEFTSFSTPLSHNIT
jgi:hypothetical protein